MNLLFVFPIALALAMDAFAVSVGISMRLGRVTNSQGFRLALNFGFFQFMMAILGWLAGHSILRYIQTFDHWAAFGLLFLIGGKMIYESFRSLEKSKKSVNDPTRGISLLMLSVATSIDALAVGLSFAALQEAILHPAIVIGLVAFLMTIIGTKIGPVIGKVAGKRAELFGGLVLIFIGVKILFEHL